MDETASGNQQSIRYRVGERWRYGRQPRQSPSPLVRRLGDPKLIFHARRAAGPYKRCNGEETFNLKYAGGWKRQIIPPDVHAYQSSSFMSRLTVGINRGAYLQCATMPVCEPSPEIDNIAGGVLGLATLGASELSLCITRVAERAR